MSRSYLIRSLFQWPHAWFVFGLIVLAWVIAVNSFPQGYIVLGGDVLQPIRMHDRFLFFHYDWFLGRVSLFYLPFYLLSSLGVSETAQLSWYLGIFLFGAYLSFHLFARLIFPRVSNITTMLISLFYATNIYTLYVFTSTWGFTHYQILYVFIPALTGLYIKALMEVNMRWIGWFLLAASVTSMSFANPAFALSLGIYFTALTGALFLLKLVRPDFSAVKKIALMIVGALLLNIYWLLPLLPQVRAGVEGVTSSTDIVLVDSLRKTSNALFDTIRLLQTHESDLYYPQNFPYPSFAWAKHAIALLAFIPFLLVLMLLRRGARSYEYRMQFLFFGLFVLFAALVAHVRFPFDGINNILFQLPGLNVLRGWDKLAIYTPFLLSVPLIGALGMWQGKWSVKAVSISFFVLMVTLSPPFYVGGIQTKMSYILANSNKKDFKTANYSSLVKIPKAYYDVENIFSKDVEENKISRLPFSPGSSVGRINLSKWGVNGPSPERALYSKQYVEPNDAYFPGWSFGEDFEDSRFDPQWIMDWYGLIGVKYIIWHKDARQESVDAMERSRKYLEGRNAISAMTDNEWFTLYKVEDKYVFPYAYMHSGNTSLYPSVAGLSEKVGEIRAHMTPLEYERKNLKEIMIPISAKIDESDVVINERYDPLWKADFVSSEGKRTVLVRDESVRYANAWKTDKVGGSGSIDIYYGPIRLLKVGMIISAVTLVVLLGGLMVSRRSMT